MMMPSTMILTICISMVLKHNRGLSLDIGSRYERAEHKTHNSTRYVGLAESGLGRGSKPTPRQKFSVTSVRVIFSQWGVKSLPTLPPPSKNRTLATRVGC